jgi:hypothetical protein
MFVYFEYLNLIVNPKANRDKIPINMIDCVLPPVLTVAFAGVVAGVAGAGVTVFDTSFVKSIDGGINTASML